MVKEYKYLSYVYLHRNWFLNRDNLNTHDSEHMEKNFKSSLFWKSAVHFKVAVT